MTPAQQKLLERAVDALERIADALHASDASAANIADQVSFVASNVHDLGESVTERLENIQDQLAGEHGETVPDVLTNILRSMP